MTENIIIAFIYLVILGVPFLVACALFSLIERIPALNKLATHIMDSFRFDD